MMDDCKLAAASLDRSVFMDEAISTLPSGSGSAERTSLASDSRVALVSTLNISNQLQIKIT